MTFDPRDIPKAVWGVAFDDFIGPSLIGSQYEFDGRDEDNAVHFDADIGERELWQSADALYKVCPTADPDWQPASTVLLVHDDIIVGFYAQGMIWIDPEHRGKGLAPNMILAGCLLHGGVPYDNTETMGFSDAGYAAHQAAHRLAVGLAVEAGLPVPEAVQQQTLGVGRDGQQP